MRLSTLRLVLLLISLLASAVRAQQFMLPPPTRQLSEPPGFDLFVTQMTNDQRGQLWIASRNGLIRFDGQQLRSVNDPTQPPGSRFRRLTPAPDGRIWMRQSRVGFTSRLAYFDPAKQRIVSLPDTVDFVGKFLRKNGLEALYVDRRGQLWICLPDNGLLRVNPQTLIADHVFRQKIMVQALAEGPDGTMWLGTSTGLCAFNAQTGQSRYYHHDPRQATTTIGSDEVTAIRVRDNGDVVVGLYNEVDILTPTTGQIRHIRLPLPIPTSRMWTEQIIPDRYGNDYFSVGVMVFRLTGTGQLQRLEFARPAEKIISIFVSQGHGTTPDQLWVNAARRLDQYDLSRLRPLPSLNVLDVVVNGIRLIENTQKPEDRFQRDTAGHASLTVQENDFVQLRFAPFAESKTTAFRYKLDGYDHQWTSYTDQFGAVTYQPPAGQYTFLFNRVTRGGWEKRPANIQINVRPPFWKTAWFITLVLFAAVGLMAWGVRATRRRQKLRQELARREGEAASLRQLDEFKTQFFANVTHEFRTPLTIILNATEQLGNTALNQPQRDRLASIQRNSHQLLRLINETLDIAKLDAGKLEQHTHIGDPIAFVGQIVAQFEGLAGQKGIDLKWIPEDGPNANIPNGLSSHSLYGFDDNKLEKIIYNLLGNALKFTPTGGQVRAEAHITNAHWLILRVTDTGIGIPADQLARIFERFHQVDASATRVYSGTGIGLALVKELTEWLGGRVGVNSEPDRGSVFTVELPLIPQTTAEHPGQPLPVPNGTVDTALRPQLVECDGNGRDSGPVNLARTSEAVAKPVVLIVEDNDEMRQYVAEYLSPDYRVLTAVHGRDGLERAIAEVPDLIVSDVMMPELDGYELTERLKADERTSHIPVVLLTARASYDSKLKGLGVGADDYLGKPFSLAELSLRIRNCLQTRQNWQQRLMPQPTPITAPPEPVANLRLDKEERFLARLRQLILDNMENELVDVDWLADGASMSRTQLYRKLVALTTLSPNRFIQQVRLERAAELLQTGELNIAQVSYQTGYSSQSYFTKVFQEHFGYAPSKLKV